MSTYAIGDIHGCFKALKLLFEQADFQAEDNIVFLGDYVDRGPGVKQTIDFLLERSKIYQIAFLKGNHELMMLDARNGGRAFKFWHKNGGRETLESYGTNANQDWIEAIEQSHWDFLENSLPYHRAGENIFVHAALEPGVALHEQSEKYLYWQKITDPPAYAEGIKVICGHTSQKNGKIADWGHTMCIDTYAYGGYWLTCLNVETNEYIQASELGTVKVIEN